MTRPPAVAPDESVARIDDGLAVLLRELKPPLLNDVRHGVDVVAVAAPAHDPLVVPVVPLDEAGFSQLLPGRRRPAAPLVLDIRLGELAYEHQQAVPQVVLQRVCRRRVRDVLVWLVGVDAAPRAEQQLDRVAEDPRAPFVERVGHEAGEDDRAADGQGSARPPEVQRRDVPAADRLVANALGGDLPDPRCDSAQRSPKRCWLSVGLSGGFSTSSFAQAVPHLRGLDPEHLPLEPDTPLDVPHVERQVRLQNLNLRCHCHLPSHAVRSYALSRIRGRHASGFHKYQDVCDVFFRRVRRRGTSREY